MAPSKQHPLKTEEEEGKKEHKNRLLTDFFMRKRKGRPKKKGNLARDCIYIAKQGRAASAVVNNKPVMHEASKGLKKKAPPSKVLKVKKAQANYSSGEALKKLTTDLNEWNAGTGRALDSNGEKRGLVEFSNLFGIPFDAFRKYFHWDPEKRREVGKSSGRPSLLTKGNQGVISDALARLDRTNDGLDLSGAIDLVQDISPHLSRTQARQTFSRTIRPNHPNTLKPKTMIAQATTAKRSAIIVPQQFRWLRTYNGCLDNLQRRNLGVYNLTGKTFGELIRHFIFGGDETCMQACANGVVKVVGSAGPKKHEKKMNDSCVSITMYRTGNIADVTGPTIFLLEGKINREGFTTSSWSIMVLQLDQNV
jgi:hypothetical protein